MDKLREVVRFILIASTLISIAMGIVSQVDVVSDGTVNPMYSAITVIENAVVGYVFLRLIGAVK